MGTDHHTPYQDGITEYKAADMNSPLAELDDAITLAVVAPVSHADDYVPQWDGVDAKTLKQGFPITGQGKSFVAEASVVGQRAALEVDIVGVGVAYQSTDKPGDAAEIDIILPYGIEFPADFVGSDYRARTGPAGAVEVYIERETSTSVPECILSVALGEITGGTFNSGAAAVQFAAGEVLRLVFPVQDASWAGVSIMLKGTRLGLSS